MGIDSPCILFLDNSIIQAWSNPCLFLYSKGPACRAFTVQFNFQPLADNHSGEFDEANQTIKINQNHPDTRNRFTIAHEIGHDVLGHHGISLRSTALGSYESVLEKSNEMAANNFAATLLMPRKLLVKLVNETINRLGLDDAGLTKQQVGEVTKIISQELAVSEETMTYRLQNVRMFVKRDD